jgi:hypothetical protein
MLSIIRKTINTSALINNSSLMVDQVIEIAKEHALAFEVKTARI